MSGFVSPRGVTLKHNPPKADRSGKSGTPGTAANDFVEPQPTSSITKMATRPASAHGLDIGLADPLTGAGSAAARPLNVSSRFGVRLRELRRAHSLTQLEVAIAFGIDRSFISDVERGRKSISLPLLEILAIGFKLSLSELFRDL